MATIEGPAPPANHHPPTDTNVKPAITTTNLPGTPADSPPPAKKPTVIGIYGVSGCGKSHLLKQLKENLRARDLYFSKGSGLDTFKGLTKAEKIQVRKDAIADIAKRCNEAAKPGIVTGHFIFWGEEQDAADWQTRHVLTSEDLQTYTQILSLEQRPDVVVRQTKQDQEIKSRTILDADDIHQWKFAEKSGLRSICRDHDILFTTLRDSTVAGVETLVNDCSLHSLEHNEKLAANALDRSTTLGQKTVIMIDADKTLRPQDASAIFWQKPGYADPLKQLFGKMVDEEAFAKLCELVAFKVTICPEFRNLLHKVAKSGSTGAVIVTCGLRRVWEHVLEREGFKVPIIDGGRISDDCVVTSETKGNLARRLREDCGLQVCAFGDSLVDMQMLKEADQAFVVVGSHRNKWTIILVDWVINSGKSILDYVRYIRTHLSRQIRIVLVAGVVQEEAVQGEDGVVAGGKLQQGLKGLGEDTLVALRTSKNNYHGSGPTDTGHRLFNSTHLK